MAKKRIGWAAALVVWVLAVIFGTEALCQRAVLALPGGERCVQEAALEDVTVAGGAQEEWAEAWDEEAAWDEESWDEEAWDEEEVWADEEAWTEDVSEETDAPDGPVTEVEATAGQTIILPLSGYVQTMTLRGNVAGEDGSYTVRCVLPDGSAWETSSYFWGLMEGENRDSVTIGREVASVEVTFTGSTMVLTGAEADNRFLLSPYRMLLSGAIAAGLFLLLALRRTIGRRAEVGFLIVGLCVGLVLSICQPPCIGMTLDDETHYSRIALLSHGSSGYRTAAENLMIEHGFLVAYSEMYHHETDTLQDQLAFAAAVDAAGEDMTPVETAELQWAFSDTGYVTQALGYGLARVLGMPLSWQIIMARVFNMLTYVLLTYLGIRALGRFKITLSAIALMPTPLFQACSITYDTTINALCFLGTALAMSAILERGKPLSWQKGLAIFVTLILGSVSKVVYIPLLLLVLLLPRSKFSSSPARVWYKTLAVVLCLMTVLTMVMSVGGGAVDLQDSRGGAVDSSEQIAYVLHHPFTYLRTFFYSLWSGFEIYFVTSGRLQLGFAGSVGGAMNYLSLLLIAFAVITDNDPALNQRLNWRLRLAMLIIVMMVLGLTFTTMYVAFTPVGNGSVGGVQGRYLLPVMPLMFMLCSPEGVQNRMSKTGWHTIFFLLNGVIMASACIQVLAQYGL